MICKNLTDQGRCSRGLHGGTPSAGVCAMCGYYDGPLRGLGDVVDAAATLLRLKQIIGDCGGCAQRRADLNAAIPFDDGSSKES